MDLAGYHGQCVRVTDWNGDVFEGICSYHHPDYNAHEFGRREECLQILDYLFFKDCIRHVESLEEHTGPYGRFSDPYGRIEETAVQEGIDSIREVLFGEENEHIRRLLRCLERYLDSDADAMFSCRGAVIVALRELYETTDDDAIRTEAKRLIETWGNRGG